MFLLECVGEFYQETWEPYPKEYFWRSERVVCLEAPLLPKPLLVQPVQGPSRAEPPRLTKLPSGLLHLPQCSCYDCISLNQIKGSKLLTSHKNINTVTIKGLTQSCLRNGGRQAQGLIFPYMCETFFFSSLGV